MREYPVRGNEFKLNPSLVPRLFKGVGKKTKGAKGKIRRIKPESTQLEVRMDLVN